jgi:hypothetical protein
MGLYRHVSPHLEYSNALQCITVYCSTVRYSALFIKYSSVLKVQCIALQNGLVRPDAALCPLLSQFYNTALHTEHITQCIALHTGIGLGGSFQAQQVPVWNKTIYFEQGLRGRCYP